MTSTSSDTSVPPDPLSGSRGLVRLNAAPGPEALAALRDVCASTAWGNAVLARRPYAGVADLLAAGDTATAGLDGEDLAEAMAGHPPIGRPRPGDPTSAREQRGMTDASERLRAEMLELNLAYQERFGHVFLICATGATGEQMRDAIEERLGHTPEREREIARTELGKINRIRLTRLVTTEAATEAAMEEATEEATEEQAEAAAENAETPASVSTHILDTSLGRPASGVPVALAARGGPDASWVALGASKTDGDGRCKDLPTLPAGTVQVRLEFDTDVYLAAATGTATTTITAGNGTPPAETRQQHTSPFFPEVAVTFRVTPGEHYHVPLLLNPFGYSVYRGS
ncbi:MULTISPECIES: 2-oxo-4-hydroxy-4-carboxy-5-ureidoimidazoline decarboxylase [unclassified Streptomyces]|uniref:2-oxo-4-hydroxy-4-carboxy-5-ureidoimidazoline decarboxylase n=1 Tax=unclassified Streptomyces TaxID=2593676 RepID=UPI00381C27A0